MEVLCENSVNVKSTSGVFLHNNRITDLSTSDCLVTLMHNLFVRVMGGERSVRGVHERRVSISKAMDLNYLFFIVFVRVSLPPPPVLLSHVGFYFRSTRSFSFLFFKLSP